MGYRYYDKRKMTPLFPFGFGLSYTRFAYDNLRLSTPTLREGETLTVSVDITNIGQRAGKEIVQLYISAPQQALPREPRALTAFAKVALEPGETRSVSMNIQAQDLACYHPTLQRWVMSSGDYGLHIARSSRDIALQAVVSLQAAPWYLPLKPDNSLQQLLQQPAAFRRVTALVAQKSGQPEGVVGDRLASIAPELFCGMFIGLTEFLAVDISIDELEAALQGSVD
ncbi:Thermostable beta-glucosidase B [Serratia odorifera]|uniref:Beta-D-glucoside glucohydrolase n=1 Tax=Serratia odorifera TaxID=618 RepID=A0A3S5D6W7_SEROD|nr:Thermostable beta-glucosidase B [Serratia odorifera]